MDSVSEVTAGQFSTRDLGTFNRWLCITRLRAATAVLAFAVVMSRLTPGSIALPPVIAICLGLFLVSGLGLASRRATETRWFFVLQTFADIAAITLGLRIATGGLPALLMRPLFAVVVVPASLISVPIGLIVAAAATLCHVALLVAEHGIADTSFASFECLTPPFLFFLIAQQSFFYGAHLERKNTTLAALADEVRAASALKTEFVGAVSHELRSPLNVILGYLEMALDGALGPVTPELEAALRSTRHQSHALLEMITALLDLNRFESGRVPVERAPVSIGPLLTEVAEQLQESWRRPGVVVRVASGESLPVLETDRGKVKTVLRNLLHNALKFTQRGEVRIGAHVTPRGDVALTVEDTGCGIPEEALGYIFDMFRQVPGSSGAGVGLGLHIVRRLVDALGGTITVKSRVGVGSCFTVTLPARTEISGGRSPVARAA
jgi:signal transduction histidine kinase